MEIYNTKLQYNSFFSLLPSLLGSLYLVFYPSSVYIPETQLLGGVTHACAPRFLCCYWQFWKIFARICCRPEAFQPIETQLIFENRFCYYTSGSNYPTYLTVVIITRSIYKKVTLGSHIMTFTYWSDSFSQRLILPLLLFCKYPLRFCLYLHDICHLVSLKHYYSFCLTFKHHQLATIMAST